MTVGAAGAFAALEDIRAKGTQSNAATVYGYLDGNTNGASPDLTIWSNLAECGQAPGLATDRAGNLYVADGTTLWEFAVAPGMNPSQMPDCARGANRLARGIHSLKLPITET